MISKSLGGSRAREQAGTGSLARKVPKGLAGPSIASSNNCPGQGNKSAQHASHPAALGPSSDSRARTAADSAEPDSPHQQPGEESRVLLNQLSWLGSHLKAQAPQGGLHVGPTCCPDQQWLDPCAQLPACCGVMGQLLDEAMESPANPLQQSSSKYSVHGLLWMLQFLRCAKVDELHLS